MSDLTLNFPTDSSQGLLDYDLIILALEGLAEQVDDCICSNSDSQYTLINKHRLERIEFQIASFKRLKKINYKG